MAYYAFIDENNKVVEVIAGKDEDETLPTGFSSWEEYYQTKRDSLTCKKFRGNFASIGAIYKPDGDYFTPAQEYNNWIYDETIGNLGDWKAPIDKPTVEDDNAEVVIWNDDGDGSWDIYEWNSTTEIWELKE